MRIDKNIPNALNMQDLFTKQKCFELATELNFIRFKSPGRCVSSWVVCV